MWDYRWFFSLLLMGGDECMKKKKPILASSSPQRLFLVHKGPKFIFSTHQP